MPSRRSHMKPYPVPSFGIDRYGNIYQIKEKKLTDFYYTDLLDPVYKSGSFEKSEAVECLYYNERTQELLVGIAESGTAYLYKAVPVFVWRSFKNAVSKGYYYAKVIKGEYGPGTYMGYTDDVEVEKYGSVTALPNRAAAGTPKALSEDPRTSPSVAAFPLSSDPTGKEENRLYEIVFTTGDSDVERTRKTEATSMDEALSALDEVAEMLDLNFHVKRVTVHFE